MMNRSIASRTLPRLAERKRRHQKRARCRPARRRPGEEDEAEPQADQQPAVEGRHEQISVRGRQDHGEQIDERGAQEHPGQRPTGTFSQSCARRGRTAACSAASSARRWSQKPRSSRRIMARPLMPPTFRLFGSRNRSKPSAKIAQPRVIFHPICQMVLHVSRFKPSSSLLCSCGFYHSRRQISSFICVSPISSGADERAGGGQRAGRIAADVADQRFFPLRGRFDDGLALEELITATPCAERVVLTASWAVEKMSARPSRRGRRSVSSSGSRIALTGLLSGVGAGEPLAVGLRHVVAAGAPGPPCRSRRRRAGSLIVRPPIRP